MKSNKLFATSNFSEVRKRHKIFRRLLLTSRLEALLGSGKVLFVFESWMTWASFPIGSHRTIVKELKTSHIKVSPEIKVIFGIDKEIRPKEEIYILDHVGHTLLYLSNPKASNECYDAQAFIKQNKILLKE